MSTPARRARSAGRIATSVAFVACAAALAACTVRSRSGGAVPSSAAAVRWADSVLATLTPRERAAQLVWPQVFGDYTPDQTPSWVRVDSLVAKERVGGFVMSVGSPIETAMKINTMQRLSRVPLLIGADYEAGAGFR